MLIYIVKIRELLSSLFLEISFSWCSWFLAVTVAFCLVFSWIMNECWELMHILGHYVEYEHSGTPSKEKCYLGPGYWAELGVFFLSVNRVTAFRAIVNMMWWCVGLIGQWSRIAKVGKSFMGAHSSG